MGIPARISIVTLGVADVARAGAFYEALGWERAVSSQEEIQWFHTADSNLGLWNRDLLAQDAGMTPTPPGAFGGITLAINVSSEAEVDAALAAAVAAGGAISKPAERAEWGGYSGYFTDPDGHPWEVAHNPFFPIDDDGRVRIA